MRSAASMDAMRLLNPRLLQQAGSARGYLAVTVALGLAGAVLILVQADLLSRALAGAARGTGLAVLSGVLAWLGGEVRAATAVSARCSSSPTTSTGSMSSTRSSRSKAGRSLMSIYYEIRVAGLLPPGVLLDFEELSAAPQEAQTVLHGSLEDQKELRKLLDRLQIFGARLLEIHRFRAESRRRG